MKWIDKLQDPSFLLRFFLLGVFSSAAIFRLFNFDKGEAEMAAINLPVSFAYLSTGTEILICLMLCFRRTVIPALLLALSFLSFAISSALVADIRKAFEGFWQLFVFDLETTDIALHCTYLVIISVTILLHRHAK